MNNSLQPLLNPSSIAVIGASNSPEKVGYSILRNLKQGYKGKLYAVNPKRKEIQGLPCYKSVTDIKEKVEMVVIATPASTVVSLLEECARCGAKAVTIASSGFRDSETIKQILKIVKENSIRLLGPNCLGFISPHTKLNASFAKTPAIPGSIAFISQSGALCSTILDWAWAQRLGFSYFVSNGDMIDVSYADLIDYFADDPNVSSLVIYMESLTNAKSFLASAGAFTKTKPIVVLKSGVSQEGSHAALSHTGNLSGNDEAYEAAFRKAGVLRVNTIEELFNAAKTLTLKPNVTKNSLAIVTNAGGPGVIATDALIKHGGELAKLSQKTTDVLTNHLSQNASLSNPVDVLGDAGPDEFKLSLEAVLEDENTNGVVVIVTPQMMTDNEAIARSLIAIKNPQKKLVLTCFLGAETVKKAIEIVERNGIRNYQSPEDAVISFLNMYRHHQIASDLEEALKANPIKFSPRLQEARALIEKAIEKGEKYLLEQDAKKLLSCYEIPVTESYLVKSPQEAATYSEKAGFPVILKIVSPDILHKTEVGGYIADVRTKTEAENAFTKIIESVKKHLPDAQIDGVVIEKMQNKRYELFLGSKKDPLFGPIIVFGAGGVSVEMVKDTVSDLPPLNMVQARQLINRTKISKLLAGYRSIPSINMVNLESILCEFAQLVLDFPEIDEIDINPLAVDEASEVVLDAKILLSSTA